MKSWNHVEINLLCIIRAQNKWPGRSDVIWNENRSANTINVLSSAFYQGICY